MPTPINTWCDHCQAAEGHHFYDVGEHWNTRPEARCDICGGYHDLRLHRARRPIACVECGNQFPEHPLDIWRSQGHALSGSRRSSVNPSREWDRHCHYCWTLATINDRHHQVENRAARRAQRTAQRHMTQTARYQGRPGTRKFGVEIEFLGNMYDVERCCQAEGLDCQVEGYNHAVRRHWKIVPDGSVRGGGELVSPPLAGQAGIDQIEAVGRALTAAGARVSTATGLHVHLDAANLGARQIWNLVSGYCRLQPVINGFLARSRSTNNYCRPWSRSELTWLEQHIMPTNDAGNLCRAIHDRYRAVNLGAYAVHGTIEFRQHQGTLEARKILRWVELLQAMADHCLVDDQMGDTLDSMADHLGLSAEQVAFFSSRTATLARRTRQPIY